MPLDVRYVDLSTGKWKSYKTGQLFAPYVDDIFVYGVTEPTLLDPLNPTPSDNVGWDGDASGGTMGDPNQPSALTVTVPANTTWTNRIIYANVVLSDDTSRLENCIVFGGAYATNRLGLVMAASGGSMLRTTVYGTAKSVNYYTNAVRVTGGTLVTDRCAFFRTIDSVRCTTGTDTQWIDYGSYGTRFAFFDNDLDHPTGTSSWPAYWTHNDLLQASTVSSKRHELHGTKMESFFETEGVVWTGGGWGKGTASGGTIGMPATALNAGYWSVLGKGTWCNGITMSNGSGHKLLLDRVFLDGVNATSGMVQFTVSNTTTPNQVEIQGGQWGLGGKPSGSGKFYLATWGSSTLSVIGSGSNVPRFANTASVPPALRGQPITFTATGASIVP
jgi:hypothetical protein